MADLDKIKIKLKNLFEEKGLENIKINLESGSKTGDGYAGVIIRALINGEKNNVPEEHDVIVKCVPMNLDIRHCMPITGVFNKENLFYSYIVPFYLKIQNEANIPEEKKLVLPKYYCSSDEYGFEFVILNNLKSLGYEMINCPTNVDYEHTAITMRSLGKLHALSIAFKEQYPEQFAKIFPELKRDLLYGSYDEYDSSGVFYYADMAYEKCLANIKNEEHKKRLLKALGNDLGKKLQFLHLDGKKKVLSHGDCWFNNMLFKYKDGKPVGHVFLDFQLVRYSSMANDIMTFIGTGADKQLRKRIWDLVDEYYTSFQETIKLLNCNPDEFCTKEDFIEEVKTQSLYGLAMKIFALPILKSKEAFKIHEVFLKKIPESFKKVDDDYVECLNDLIADFVNFGFI